jgi:hypothetical protein
VSNATLNRFFSLHYILPFVLAALVVAHLIALHINGSNNPNGVQNGGDRYTFYPYFIFKDLVTIFAFFLVLSIFVFYFPNAMGQRWPYIMLLIVFIIYICAISWKYTLNNYLVKIYNKTILLSDLFNLLSFSLGRASLARLTVIFILKFSNKLTKPSLRNAATLLKFFITINPNIVISYYEVYNQQITKVLLFICNFNFIRKLRSRRLSLKITLIRIRVGISETIRTQKKIITNKFLKDNFPFLHSIRPSYNVKVDIFSCSSLYHSCPPAADQESFPYGAEHWLCWPKECLALPYGAVLTQSPGCGAREWPGQALALAPQRRGSVPRSPKGQRSGGESPTLRSKGSEGATLSLRSKSEKGQPLRSSSSSSSSSSSHSSKAFMAGTQPCVAQQLCSHHTSSAALNYSYWS